MSWNDAEHSQEKSANFIFDYVVISAGWVIYLYKLVKIVSCVCLCVWMLTRLAQSVTATALHTESCNLVCTDLLMNPDCTPKTRSVWPTFLAKITYGKSWVWVGIFKPAEPHSPRDDYWLFCPSLCPFARTNLHCKSLQRWYFINCFREFYQIYNFEALGDKCELIRFWDQRSRSWPDQVISE